MDKNQKIGIVAKWKTAFSRFASKILDFVSAKDQFGNNRMLGTVRFGLGLAFLLEFTIESLCRHSVIQAAAFLLTSFYVFAFKNLIIYLTFLPAFWVRRKVFCYTLVSLLWLAMGVTDCVVTNFRVTPFSVVDILNITGVFPIISVYLNFFEILLIVFAILLAIFGLVFLGIKAPKAGRNLKKAALTSGVTVVLLVAASAFGVRADILSTHFTNLSDAYVSYGFPYCFSIGIFDRGVSRPKDYGDEEMNQILSALNDCPKTETDHRPNLVFVQLESFFNVLNLSNIQFSENPIPNFTRLSQEGISGELTVPVIGAGTINTEFEILSGMNLDYFGTGEYPYKTSLSSSTCETLPYNLMELGYSTHAIHNYRGTFYHRNLVYQNMGFETFTSLEYMQDVEYNISGVWPKDQVLIRQILDALESTETSDFVMAVSVQGHGKYPPNDLPEDYDPQITAEFIDGTLEGGLSDIGALIYYVNQLYEMDLFVNDLVETIRNYSEDTVLVLYGDHLPSLSIDKTDLVNGSEYVTPYLIISNFGLEEQVSTLGNLEAYQLGAGVLNLVGFHNGFLTRLHQFYSTSDKYQQWLEEMEYDMLGASSKHILYGGVKEYYPKMENFQMGVKPITIERWERDGEWLVVYGENFTEASKIVFGNKVENETEYIDGNTLRVKKIPENAVTIAVAQVSSNGVQLSVSEEVVYFPPTTSPE